MTSPMLVHGSSVVETSTAYHIKHLTAKVLKSSTLLHFDTYHFVPSNVRYFLRVRERQCRSVRVPECVCMSKLFFLRFFVCQCAVSVRGGCEAVTNGHCGVSVLILPPSTLIHYHFWTFFAAVLVLVSVLGRFAVRICFSLGFGAVPCAYGAFWKPRCIPPKATCGRPDIRMDRRIDHFAFAFQTYDL